MERQFSKFAPNVQKQLVNVGKVWVKHPGAVVKVLSPETQAVLQAVTGFLNAMKEKKAPSAVLTEEIKAERNRLTMAIQAMVDKFGVCEPEQSIGLYVKEQPGLSLTLHLGKETRWAWGANRQDFILKSMATFERLLTGDVNIELLTGGDIKGDFATAMRIVQLINKDAV